VSDAKRRTFTAEYKLRIFKEAEAAKGSGGIGALLRRDGLYSSHLVTWRHERQVAVQQALAPKTRRPKTKHDPNAEELHKRRRENQLTESLHRVEIVIDVQKKKIDAVQCAPRRYLSHAVPVSWLPRVLINVVGARWIRAVYNQRL
jgi:hypothetical protein